MIPQAAVQAWSTTRAWPTLVAVEQDLVLARLIVEIARHPLLGDELVFRGGTCLHQLVLDQPLRYSEDIDFVRSTHSGIGPVIDALREVADGVGLHVAGTDIRQHPKIRLRAPRNGSFRGDLNALVATWPSGYDTDEAAELVIAEVLSRL